MSSRQDPSRIVGLLLCLACSSAAEAQPFPPPAVTIEAADHGVRTDPTVDNSWALLGALRAASDARPRGEWAAVALPCHAPFAESAKAIGYAGEIAMPDSVALMGCGGAERTRQVDNYGHVYYPVREVAERGARESRLRLLDDAVGERQAGNRSISHRIRSARGVAAVALRDLVLDGNWQGNLDAFNQQSRAWKESNLRNAPGWSGFVSNNHGGWEVRCTGPPDPRGRMRSPGTAIEITRVAVTGYGATGLLGHLCTRWALVDVVVGDALYNHTLYNVYGTWDHVTVRGFAWTHIVGGLAEVEGLVYERPARSPAGRDGAELVNARGSGFHARGIYLDTRTPEAGPPPFHTFIRNEPRTEVAVERLLWLATSPRAVVRNQRGWRVRAEALRIYTDGTPLRAFVTGEAEVAPAWAPPTTEPGQPRGVTLSDAVAAHLPETMPAPPSYLSAPPTSVPWHPPSSSPAP